MKSDEFRQHLIERHSWSVDDLTPEVLQVSIGRLRKQHRDQHPECWLDEADSLCRHANKVWPTLTIHDVLKSHSRLQSDASPADDLDRLVLAWVASEKEPKSRKSDLFGFECVYCQFFGGNSNTRLTKEHVPPQAIYLTPCRDAIYVPACDLHNQEQSKDDDLFALAVFTWAFKRFPTEQFLQDIVRRRRKSPKLMKQLLRTMGREEIRSTGGIITALVPTFDVQLHRLKQSLAKVAIGLHWRQTRTALPPGTTFRMAFELSFEELLPLSAYPNTIGPIGDDHAFSCRYLIQEDGSSLWLLTFYNEFPLWVGAFPSGTDAPDGRLADPDELLRVSSGTHKAVPINLPPAEC